MSASPHSLAGRSTAAATSRCRQRQPPAGRAGGSTPRWPRRWATRRWACRVAVRLADAGGSQRLPCDRQAGPVRRAPCGWRRARSAAAPSTSRSPLCARACRAGPGRRCGAAAAPTRRDEQWVANRRAMAAAGVANQKMLVRSSWSARRLERPHDGGDAPYCEASLSPAYRGSQRRDAQVGWRRTGWPRRTATRRCASRRSTGRRPACATRRGDAVWTTGTCSEQYRLSVGR